MRRRAFFTAAASTVAAAGAISLAFNDVGRLEISYLTAGLGCKVVFLPDLHLHGDGVYERRLLDTVNELEPDVAMLGGDLVDRLTHDIGFVERFISAINASEKFYVLGNHEYWSGYANTVRNLLDKHGYRELRGAVESRYVGSLYGLDWRDDRVYPFVESYGLVVVHDPNAADYIKGDCIILAGHTHGGLVINNQTLLSNSKYVRGLYRLGNGTVLYVSRGLGQMIPIRLLSPPELLVLV
ncbi:MAG: metallophosphoesterase [Candidatus Caldarchaeum sp.]